MPGSSLDERGLHLDELRLQSRSFGEINRDQERHTARSLDAAEYRDAPTPSGSTLLLVTIVLSISVLAIGIVYREMSTFIGLPGPIYLSSNSHIRTPRL